MLYNYLPSPDSSTLFLQVFLLKYGWNMLELECNLRACITLFPFSICSGRSEAIDREIRRKIGDESLQ